MLLDASETTLGIFGFSRELYGKPKDKDMVDGIEKEQDERRTSRSKCEMIESQGSHQTTELVAFHKAQAKIFEFEKLGNGRSRSTCDV